MIAAFLLGDDALELEFFQCLFQRVDFILCTSFMFQVTSAREVWRSTLQLISAPEKKFTLFGLPEKTAIMTGFAHWQFHDNLSLTKRFIFHVTWLRNVATSPPTLRNAVIGGKCHMDCSVSKSITLLSQAYNFTVAGCADPHTHCDFTEFGDRRVVRRLISTGTVLPLIFFSSQKYGFLII